MLKCTKCNTDKLVKVNASEIEKIEETLTDDKRNAILKCIKKDLYEEDEINAFLSDFKEYSEVDAIEFLSGEKEAEEKLIDLFYRRDVVQGSIVCVDCGDEKFIKDGVLHIAE